MYYIVNGLIWHVYEVPGEHGKLWDNGRYTLGMCDGNECAIYIRQDLPNWKYEKVLMHEIAHSFIMSFGLLFDADQEEDFCNLFAEHGREMIYVTDKILTSVMGDNYYGY